MEFPGETGFLKRLARRFISSGIDASCLSTRQSATRIWPTQVALASPSREVAGSLFRVNRKSGAGVFDESVEFHAGGRSIINPETV